MAKQRKKTGGGFGLALFMLAWWRIYARRTCQRIPGQEGIEDEAVTRGFDWVSRTPQMAWLRRYVTGRALALRDSGEAIDLGCGPGYLLFEMARHAPNLRLTGVDLSAEMLKTAEAEAAQAGLSQRVAFRSGDAQQIPFADGSLDLVVSTLSLHHWRHPVGVFDEIARVLKPGGAFLVFDLRRDMPAPSYLLIWFATQFIVPAALHQIGEPMGSRNAAYTAGEVAEMAVRSKLRGWQVNTGPLWVVLEGKKE